MGHICAFIALVVLTLPLAVGAEVFRCTDSAGKVEYTDAPCDGTAGRKVAVHQNVLPAQDLREKILKDENQRLRAELEAAKAKEGPATQDGGGRTQADLQAEKGSSFECTRAKRSFEVAASSIQPNRNTDPEELAMYSACGMKPPDRTIVHVTNVHVRRSPVAVKITGCDRQGCVDERGNRYKLGQKGVMVGPRGACTQFGLRLNCP